MRKQSNRRLDAVFGALSDPIRRTILAQLAHGECSITKLAQPFDVSAPAITKHLRVLESSGLINRRKQGRVNYCCLGEDPFREANDWIQQQRAFWEQQLAALESYLQKEKEECNNQPAGGLDSPSGSKGVSTPRAKESSTPGRNRKS
jgi:DNA-binding transcriptional ArsR family regulator